MNHKVCQVLFFSIFVLSLLIPIEAKQCEIEIEVTAPEVPPLIEFSEERITGDLAIQVQKFFAKYTTKSRLTNANWARILKLAKSGSVDAIFPIIHSIERTQYLDYSIAKLTNISFSLYGKKNTDDSSEELKQEYTVAIPRDIKYDKSALNGAKVFEVTHFEHAVKMLDANRVDYMVGVTDTVEHLVSQKKLSGIKEVKFIGSYPVYVALAKNSPNYHALLDCFGGKGVIF